MNKQRKSLKGRRFRQSVKCKCCILAVTHIYMPRRRNEGDTVRVKLRRTRKHAQPKSQRDACAAPQHLPKLYTTNQSWHHTNHAEAKHPVQSTKSTKSANEKNNDINAQKTKKNGGAKPLGLVMVIGKWCVVYGR